MNLVKMMVGYRPRINNKKDAKCMDGYLRGAPESELVMTNLGPDTDYLPAEAPLLDFLTVDTEGPTGSKYPRLEELRRFQQKRGLIYSVLEDVEVREIIYGVSSTKEIIRFHEWVTEKHLENQDSFDTSVISMDVEEVKASYYDVMPMAGKIVIDRPVSGLLEDC